MRSVRRTGTGAPPPGRSEPCQFAVIACVSRYSSLLASFFPLWHMYSPFYIHKLHNRCSILNIHKQTFRSMTFRSSKTP